MLSICIPRYNYDPSRLIAQLRAQIHGEAEIIVIDDASTETLPVPACDQFIQLEKNIGRAAIRNRFLQYATYDWLIFLDNDVELIDKDFVNRYLDLLPGRTAEGRAERSVQHPTFSPTPSESFSPESFRLVIYGGRTYSPTPPDLQHMLRWKYGKHIESKPANQRSKDPYISFQTNNFLVHRSVLTEFPFDESLKDYGYEDLLFAEQLRKQNIPIIHIDNPVLNIHLESNERFLELTKMAMRNLNVIQSKYNLDTRLIKASAIARYIPKTIEKKIYNRLSSGRAGLWEFQLWKSIIICK